jgi:hypothetical protein
MYSLYVFRTRSERGRNAVQTRSRGKLETCSPLWLTTAFSHRKIPTLNEIWATVGFDSWQQRTIILSFIPVSQQIWIPLKMAPRSKSASEYEPGSPYPLANMDLWGSLFASGFGLPSRIWTPRVFYHCNVLYFEYCTESVLYRHKFHLIYFKNRTKIFRSSNLRFLD